MKAGVLFSLEHLRWLAGNLIVCTRPGCSAGPELPAGGQTALEPLSPAEAATWLAGGQQHAWWRLGWGLALMTALLARHSEPSRPDF